MVAFSVHQQVRDRAHHCCEYCRLPQRYSPYRLQLDHVVAQQHVTDDTLNNLALACVRCNGSKGPNVAGFDPVSRRVIPLFNPRTQIWQKHFALQGAKIVGVTDIGRVTVHVLNMNDPAAVALRESLISHGEFPSKVDQ